MKKSIIFAASAMFAFAGCTKDAITPNTPDSKLATISATTAPQEDETRTSLSDGDILWTEGDHILLRLASDHTKSADYTLKTGAGTAKGTFEGKALPEELKWAFYPQSGTQYWQANETIKIILTKFQPYKAGSFGNGVNPMVAKSDEAGENLAFLNICGAIRLKLTGTATVKQIVVATAGEFISGDAQIDMTYTDDPQVQLNSTNTNTAIVLTDINETLDPVTPTEFTIMLPPGAYAAGMNFRIETSDGTFMNKVTTAPITVTRSKVLPLAAFEVTGTKAFNFPDKNFRAFLKKREGFVLSNEGTVDEDIDINNVTNKEKFNSMTGIGCYEKSIASLKGIEHFTALTDLSCSGNLLVSLDLTHNTALTNLSCGDNQLTSLDLPASTALKSLDCDYNQLTSLDLSANTALTHLGSHKNQLTSLKLPATTTLTYLDCNDNKLTELDVTANTALTYLHCQANQFSVLDLTHNTADIYLRIGAQVAADGTLLDMTAYVSENQTSELDNSNGTNDRATLVKGNPPTPAPAIR